MRYEDQSDALAGGQWVPNPATGGLTLIWQPDPTNIAAVPDVPTCPKCGALPWESCRSKSGKRLGAHRSRPTARLCACGAEAGPRSVICGDCARERDLSRKRDYNQRSRHAA